MTTNHRGLSEPGNRIRIALFAFFVSCAVVAPAFGAAFPQSLTLSWTNASTYEDGTPIEAVDLTGVRIECIRANDGSLLVTATFVPTGVGLSQTETFADVINNAGTYECIGFTIVSDGTESVASNTASKKFIGKPNPPNSMGIN
jgi:hypothetical protein